MGSRESKAFFLLGGGTALHRTVSGYAILGKPVFRLLVLLACTKSPKRPAGCWSIKAVTREGRLKPLNVRKPPGCVYRGQTLRSYFSDIMCSRHSAGFVDSAQRLLKHTSRQCLLKYLCGASTSHWNVPTYNIKICIRTVVLIGL